MSAILPTVGWGGIPVCLAGHPESTLTRGWGVEGSSQGGSPGPTPILRSCGDWLKGYFGPVPVGEVAGVWPGESPGPH